MAIQGDLAQILCGGPIPIPQCNIVITQPKIKQICAIGEDNFLMGVKFFTDIEQIVSSVKEGNSQLAMLSDFQILMIIIDGDITLKRDIESFFELIFPEYQVRFDPGSICFLREGESRILGQINPMNFEPFQQMLEQLFLPYGSVKQEDYNPANAKAAEIAEKLKRGNRIRQQMQQEKSKASGSLFGSYSSILAVGLGMDINTFFNYTPFQLYDMFIRYSAKLGYDLYQKIATTPLMDVSQMTEPDNWMDDIYK